MGKKPQRGWVQDGILFHTHHKSIWYHELTLLSLVVSSASYQPGEVLEPMPVLHHPHCKETSSLCWRRCSHSKCLSPFAPRSLPCLLLEVWAVAFGLGWCVTWKSSAVSKAEAVRVGFPPVSVTKVYTSQFNYWSFSLKPCLLCSSWLICRRSCYLHFCGDATKRHFQPSVQWHQWVAKIATGCCCIWKNCSIYTVSCGGDWKPSDCWNESLPVLNLICTPESQSWFLAS